jgi:hypothetical protein
MALPAVFVALAGCEKAPLSCSRPDVIEQALSEEVRFQILDGVVSVEPEGERLHAVMDGVLSRKNLALTKIVTLETLTRPSYVGCRAFVHVSGMANPNYESHRLFLYSALETDDRATVIVHSCFSSETCRRSVFRN